MKKVAILGGVIAVLAGGYIWLAQKPEPVLAATPAIVQPQLSALASEGEAVFEGTCAACHGASLTGTDKGPPLLHPYYKPGHHSDYAIVSAVQNGVQAHHWPFGAMPAQSGISDDELVRVIAYIREMQRANGIF